MTAIDYDAYLRRKTAKRKDIYAYVLSDDISTAYHQQYSVN